MEECGPKNHFLCILSALALVSWPPFLETWVARREGHEPVRRDRSPRAPTSVIIELLAK